jgi:PhnB protein
MRLNTHLSFAGDCQAAFECYEKCLGGRITLMMKYGDLPAPPEARQDKIIHATISIGDQVLTGGDVASADYRQPQGFSVLLSAEGIAEAERIFAALAEAGDVRVPLGETFWAARFGMLADRFGTPWIIQCAKPA